MDTTDILRVKGMTLDIPGPEVLYYPEDTEIDKEFITELIGNHKKQVWRSRYLRSYYTGYAAIKDRVLEDIGKPNNKLIAPYPSYITDILTGMFIGNPIVYGVQEEDKDEFNKIQEIFDYNDEQDENHELAKINSQIGRSFEIIYYDEVDKKIKFNELDPEQVIYAYDDNINPKPLFAIYYNGEGDNFEARVFTREYDAIYSGTDLEETYNNQNHAALVETGLIKVLESTNNNERLGDYERIIPLIDAYNKSISDTANDFEEFTDAILLLIGMLNTDEEDLKRIKTDRVINLMEGQGAEWLTKTMNTEALENHKNRLDEDIHRFSKVPNLNDDKFAGNASGVALQYKMIGLQQTIAAKERKFKRFLQDRLQLIIAISKSIHEPINIKFTDISIDFNPNLPKDLKENVEMVEKLKGIISESSAIAQLHVVDDVNAELEKMEQERDVYVNRISNTFAEENEDDEDES